MKELWLLTLFVLAVSVISIEEEERRNGENGWFVPQQNDSFLWMELEEVESKLSSQKMNEMGRLWNINPVNFYLYTLNNPDKGQKILADYKTIDYSNFNPNNPTRFVIHGWFDGLDSKFNKLVRKAWLSKGDYNIISVVWPRAISLEYISSVVAVKSVGKDVALMIDFLVENFKLSLDTLHVIGHSLGAHISGYAGKYVKSGQISTIIGLDPALPLFKLSDPKTRLARTDAFYVEVIHTNAGQLGFLNPIGTSDFYPNGGKYQPECRFDPFGKCSHVLSYAYYAEAIEVNNFISIKCENYEQAVKRECGATNSGTHMAAPTNANQLRGEFFVPVNSKSPYGMGV